MDRFLDTDRRFDFNINKETAISIWKHIFFDCEARRCTCAGMYDRVANFDVDIWKILFSIIVGWLGA